MSSYQTSQSAINRFTEFLHYEYPQVRAFAYHPGCVLRLLFLLGVESERSAFLILKTEAL